MADETIGVARIDIVADGSGLEAEVAKAKNRLGSFSVDAQRSYDSLTGAAKRATTNFVKWAGAIDKTADSQKILNAAAAGVPTRIIEEAVQKMRDFAAANDAAAERAKRLADTQVFEKQHAAAQQLVKSTEYVNWWKSALDQAAAAEKELQATQLFAQQNAAAQRLVKSSEYVRWWEDALQQADIAESKIAGDRAFIRSLEDRAKAAGKTATEILEMRAAERGLSEHAAPFIAKLREQEGAVRSSGIEFNKYGLSVKQTDAALRQVPAQITDIIVSLQGGQAPLTVLLQQGGQLRDVFGGAAPALQAMGAQVAKMVTPLTVGAAVLAAIGVAAYQGATEMDALEQHLIMTGNALGMTVDQASDLAAELDSLAGVTRASAAGAITEIAKSGKIAADQIESVAKVALRSSDLLGTSVQDVIADFAKIAEDPVKGVEELDEKYSFLTQSVYDQITALVEQGRTQDAVRLATETFASVTTDRLNEVEQSLGYLDKAWNAVYRAATDAWDAMRDFGRDQTTNEIIRDGEKSLNSYIDTLNRYGLTVDSTMKDVAGKNLFGMDHARVTQALAGAREIQAIMADARAQAAGEDFTVSAAAKSKADRQERIEAEKEWQKIREDNLSREQKLENEIANIRTAGLAAGIQEADIEAQITAHREKYAKAKKSGGSSAPSQSEIAKLQAAIVIERARAKAIGASIEQLDSLNQYERQAIEIGEKLKLTTDSKKTANLAQAKALAEQAGALKRSNDDAEKAFKAQIKTTQSVKDQTKTLRDQIATYGMTESAIHDTIIARLEEQKVQAQAKGLSDVVIQGIQDEINARRDLQVEMQKKESQDRDLKEWNQWKQDIGQIFDQVGQSLTDALFEGGKSGRDLVKSLFKTLTLKVLIQPVMGALQGAVTQQLGGMLGYQNPAGGMNMPGGFGFGGNGGLGLGGVFSSLGETFGSSALDAFGAGMSGVFSQVDLFAGNVAAAAGQDAIGAMISSNTASQAGGLGAMVGDALPYIGAIYAATQGQYGTAVGTAAGAYLGGLGSLGGPMGAAIGAGIGMLVDSFMDSEPQTRHGKSTTYEMTSDLDLYRKHNEDEQSDAFYNSIEQMTQATIDGIKSTFDLLGVDAQLGSLWSRTDVSQTGKGDGVSSGGGIMVGGEWRQIGIEHSSDDTQFGFGGWSDQPVLPRLAVDLQMTMLEAFQAAAEEMPSAINRVLEGLDIRSLGAEQIAALSTTINGMVVGAQALQAAMELLPFENLKNQSLDTYMSLIQLTGGLQNLQQMQASYIDNFYSAAEKQALQIESLGRVFEGVGLAMPAIAGSADDMKAAFRGVMDSLDMSTESGLQAYAALLGIQGAFAQLADAAGAAGLAVDGAAGSLQKLWDAAVSAGEAAYSALVKSVNAEKSSLQKQHQAVTAALQASITAASKSVSELTALTNKLQSAVNSMTAVRPDQSGAYAWAQGRIERALSVAKLTGVMPEGADFETALQIASKPTEALYGSFEDYQADFLKTAHTIEDLTGLAGEQLSSEKRALQALQDQLSLQQAWYQAEIERLDIMLETQREELDIALGIYETTLSIPEALAAIATAIGNIKLTVNPGGGGGGLNSYYSDKLAQLQASGSTDYGVDWGNASVDDLRDLFQDLNLTPQEHWEKWGKDEGLTRPSFAVGTNYVPYDMTAQIHEGERIIPAADNRALMRAVNAGNGNSETAALRQEIALLRKAHEASQALLKEVSDNTRRSAEGTRRLADGETQLPVRVTGPVATVQIEDRTKEPA